MIDTVDDLSIFDFVDFVLNASYLTLPCRLQSHGALPRVNKRTWL